MSLTCRLYNVFYKHCQLPWWLLGPTNMAVIWTGKSHTSHHQTLLLTLRLLFLILIIAEFKDGGLVLQSKPSLHRIFISWGAWGSAVPRVLGCSRGCWPHAGKEELQVERCACGVHRSALTALWEPFSENTPWQGVVINHHNLYVCPIRGTLI